MSQPSPKPAPWLPWIMWGLGAAFYFYAFFQRVAPSVMVEDLMRDFAAAGAITGMLSALYFYTYAGLQLPVGVLLDSWGPRRLLTTAALVSALGSLLFATADGLWMAYLGRALIGVGAAVTWVGGLTIAAAWFPPQRFAMISGMTMALGMIGAVGGQAPLAAAVDTLGWRATMGGAAGFALLLGVALWLVVRDRGPYSPPERTCEEPTRPGILHGVGQALRRPQTWIACLYGPMMAAPILAFAGLWGVPYMMSTYGLARTDAAMATSAMLLGWGVASPIIGWMSDHFRRRKPFMVLASGGNLLVCLTWLYGGLPLWAVIGLFFVTGLFNGGMVLVFAFAREHNRLGHAGATLGFVNMAVMGSGAVFQPLIGWLLDLGWQGGIMDGARVYAPQTYGLALAVLPGCWGLALLAALLARETRCQQVDREDRPA